MSLAMCTYKNYVLKAESDVVYIKDSDDNQVEVSIETEEELEETIKMVLEEEENTDLNDKEVGSNTNINNKNESIDVDQKIDKDDPQKNSKKNSESKENDRKTEKEIIGKYKSQFYSMQKGYTSKISNMVSKAKSEYYGIPEDERTSSVKMKIGFKYYDIATALEKECDNEVDSLLSSMEKELVSNNYSTKTIELIKNYYKNQKASQKHYYMSKIKEK